MLCNYLVAAVDVSNQREFSCTLEIGTIYEDHSRSCNFEAHHLRRQVPTGSPAVPSKPSEGGHRSRVRFHKSGGEGERAICCRSQVHKMLQGSLPFCYFLVLPQVCIFETLQIGRSTTTLFALSTEDQGPSSVPLHFLVSLSSLFVSSRLLAVWILCWLLCLLSGFKRLITAAISRDSYLPLLSSI